MRVLIPRASRPAAYQIGTVPNGRYYQRVAFLRFIVQSEKHGQELDSNIEQFVATMEDMLLTMSAKDFAQHQSALSTVLVRLLVGVFVEPGFLPN